MQSAKRMVTKISHAKIIQKYYRGHHVRLIFDEELPARVNSLRREFRRGQSTFTEHVRSRRPARSNPALVLG